jgi:actin-related protein 2
MDVRKTLYNNILISGGSSMFPGYSTRLENDIRSIYTKEVLKGNGPIKIGINIIVIKDFIRFYRRVFQDI